MKFEFVHKQKKAFPTTVLCKVMNVSRSGYFSWVKRFPSKRMKEIESLKPVVSDVQRRYRSSCGSRRMCVELKKLGVQAGRKKVSTLMKIAEAPYIPAKRYRVTTDSNHNFTKSPNILNRAFNVCLPNQVWISDITYLWTQEGWLYLAIIMDLYNREIIGMAIDSQMETKLIVEALKAAYWHKKPRKGLIFHSDRGSQYCSKQFLALLQFYGMASSMSRKGNCWDNSVAESFFASLKKERTMRTVYKTRQEAKNDVLDYVYMFYNSNRVHSYLDYKTPKETAENQYLEKVS